MDTAIKQTLGTFKNHLQTTYGERLSEVILYGSEARGTATDQTSDIDVLIVLKGFVQAGAEIDRIGNVVTDLSLENDRLISCLFMSESRFNTHQSALLRNIRAEGISL